MDYIELAKTAREMLKIVAPHIDDNLGFMMQPDTFFLYLEKAKELLTEKERTSFFEIKLSLSTTKDKFHSLRKQMFPL